MRKPLEEKGQGLVLYVFLSSLHPWSWVRPYSERAGAQAEGQVTYSGLIIQHMCR